jgi:glutamate/tyrosine decarboxylase-like PLP-dependent enzyme
MTIKDIDLLKNIVIDFFADENVHPASNYISPGALQSNQDLFIPDRGKDIDEVFELLQNVVMATPRTAGKRFFNQLFGGRIFPATAADMLVSVLNNSMYTFKVAGIQVLIEQEVINNLCRCVGYKNGDGIFAPGGSIANMIAMIIARNEKQDSIRNKGFDGRKYTAYTSDQGHYSIRKNAGIIGIGRNNVREIKTDEYGKMDVVDLRSRIEEDLKNDYIPFFLNATAGTTVLGVFDLIEEIAEIAGEFNLWFHIDGAWGGTMLLSRQHRHLLKGCHKADSFTWCTHKMMGVPLSASAILIKRMGLLDKHFSERADYLFQSEEDTYNPGTKSIQCGRRNDAFKVWAAWQYYGNQGYEERVNKQFELTQYAANKIKNDKWLRLCMEPESMNVCFQVIGKSSEEICDILDKESIIKVGHGNFKGENYIRLVCVNPELTFEDIDYFFENVIEASHCLAVN